MEDLWQKLRTSEGPQRATKYFKFPQFYMNLDHVDHVDMIKLLLRQNVVEVLNSYENYERSRRSSLGRRNAYHPRARTEGQHRIKVTTF